MSPAWIELSPDDNNRMWKAFDKRFQFRASIRPATWPAISEPIPSLTFDLAPIFAGGPSRFASGEAAVNAEGLRSFVWALSEIERLAVLDWQHPGYWFRPGQHAATGSKASHTMPVTVFPNGDYYVFVSEDLRTGTFGHPWEQTLCVFGPELIDSLGVALRTWLPLKRIDGAAPA
jgi:hypothetical protein